MEGWVRRFNYGDYALPLPEGIDRWLTSHSKFYLFFLYKYNGFLTRAGLRSEAGRINAMYKPGAVGWFRTKYAIARISNVAKSYNIPAMMVLWSTDDGGQIKEAYRVVREAGTENGYHVLDLTSAQWPKENFAVSVIDGHPQC